MTKKRGPLKVIDCKGNEYTLEDCVTKNLSRVHVSRLSPFDYDPTRTNPEEIALRDRSEFEVECIVDHVVATNKLKMDFLVRWKGYDKSEDLWLPWAELRNNPILHRYLHNNGLAKLIPTEHRRLVYL
jgi:hypothetical protein